MRIEGPCDDAFLSVRDAFAENFDARGEIGAAVCVWLDGRRVVDLWGGHQDEARRVPWQRDTLVNAYSVGKGVTTLLVLRLVSDGVLDLDAPVATLWPEFAAQGKADATLRTLLSHRVGLPAIREPMPPGSWADWQVMAAALAAERPFWEPGTAHGYHVNTFGFLVGEPVCRATGLRFGEALRRLLTGPCEADYHIGLPEQEHARTAPVLGVTTGEVSEQAMERFVGDEPDPERRLMLRHAYFNPPGIAGVGTANTTAWRLAEIPSTNGHGTARGVAALYAAALSGRAGIAGEVLREATRIHSDGEDRVLGRASRFGLGFQLPHARRPIGRGPACFGHYGNGGSLGFGDRDTGLAFAYLTNLPGPRWQQPRTQALVDAAYTAVGASE